MALLSITRVFGADVLNDPILVGGDISYSPPFPMSHSIQEDSVAYVNVNNTAVSFHVSEVEPIQGKNGQEFFSKTKAPSIEELKQEVESENSGAFVETNVVANIVKIDGREAVEIYGKRKGYFGVPDMWADTIVMFWQKNLTWSRTVILGIAVSDVNQDVCQKLIESVKSARYHPPKLVVSKPEQRYGQQVELHGTCEMTNSDLVAKLICQGYEADFFIIEFSEKDKPVKIDSIRGSYQYETNSAHPLDLYFLSVSGASLRPPAADLLWLEQPRTNYVGRRIMKDGHYKLNFEYTLNSNGQTNTSRFDVNLVTKHNVKLNY